MACLVVDPYPDQEEPDSVMIPFHPYRNGDNPDHDYDSQTLVYSKSSEGVWNENRKMDFDARVRTWLMKELTKINSKVVIAIAPGHKANPNPSGFMHEILGGINHSEIVGKILLYRTKTVPKSSETPGPQSKATHEGTISLHPPTTSPTSPLTVLPSADFCQDKVIVILDDVWTSGSTLCVCKDVVKELSPKKILLYAIGRTV